MVSLNATTHGLNISPLSKAEFVIDRGVGGCIKKTMEAMATLGLVTSLDDDALYRILIDVTHLH